MRERYITVNGWKVRYVDLGAGERCALLLHGLGGSIESWRNNLAQLSRYSRVIALDLPGFGLSDKHEAHYTAEFYADFIADFLKTVKIEKAGLIGHSMGGLVALTTALRHPEVIEKLVVVDVAGLDAFTAELIRDSMGGWWDRESLRRFYERYIGRVDEEMLELRLRMYESMEARKAYLSALRALESPIPLEQFAKISQPTLIIWGEEDRLTKLETGLRLSHLIKGSTLIVIKGAGHSPHAEKPEEFNRIVLKFLEQDKS